MDNNQYSRDEVPLYMTVQDVAARLGLNVKTVYSAIKDGKMPSVRVGRTVRIPAAALQANADKTKR